MTTLKPSVDLAADLKAIAAESIGWQPLGPGAYLHHGAPDEKDTIVTVVGIPDVEMAGMNVLLLT